jgi:ribosomal protein S4
MEIKQKFVYTIGGISAKRIAYFVEASRTKTNSIFNSLLYKIETRLDVILYRINIVQSPFYIKKLLKFGYIEVDEDPVYSYNYSVPYASKVDVKLPIYAIKRYQHEFEVVLRRKLVFIPFTEYLEISYATFRSIMYTLPDDDTTFYPFDFKPNYFFRLY